MVAEGFPIKQGLKLLKTCLHLPTSFVAEGFPIKQGLKLCSERSLYWLQLIVAEGFPIKQGLKQSIICNE